MELLSAISLHSMDLEIMRFQNQLFWLHV